MRQVVFISGKGGTGKSTIVASLGHLVESKMLADCDVDAPNLHLLLEGRQLAKKDYSGAKEARIDPDLCVQCGMCRQVCRFHAIAEDYTIIPMTCEGCAACQVFCPTNAITLVPVKTGETYATQTNRGLFSHALLEIGAEASGKLVTEVRKNLDVYRKDEEWTLIDGSPGIGCTVIASITGTDAVVVVTEPTQSGLHDMNRVLATAEHFRVKAFVCINKFDLNPSITKEIEEACRATDVPVIGHVPFAPAVIKALQQGLTPVEAGLDEVTGPIDRMWQNLIGGLDQ